MNIVNVIAAQCPVTMEEVFRAMVDAGELVNVQAYPMILADDEAMEKIMARHAKIAAVWGKRVFDVTSELFPASPEVGTAEVRA